MSGVAKARRTNGVEIRVGGRRPRLFVVPATRVSALMKTLSPFEQDDSVPIEVALPDHRDPIKGPATRLRGARAKKGMTQRDLARLTGIRQSHISEMERGDRPIGKNVALRLAAGLGVDYRVFL